MSATSSPTCPGCSARVRCSPSTVRTIACRRRLLTPPFHGKSIKNYEKIFEEETLRESANWPEGQAFETLEPMMRITLNAILRAVFGADGEQLDELRRIIPPWVTLGSRLAVLPTPTRTYGRFSPWGRLAEYRRQYDEVDRRGSSTTSRPTRISIAATTCSRCCCAAPTRTVRPCHARTSATSC